MTRDRHFLDEKFDEMENMAAQPSYINGNVETIGLVRFKERYVGTVGLGRYMEVIVATVGLAHFVEEKLEVIRLLCNILVLKVIVLEFFMEVNHIIVFVFDQIFGMEIYLDIFMETLRYQKVGVKLRYQKVREGIRYQKIGGRRRLWKYTIWMMMEKKGKPLWGERRSLTSRTSSNFLVYMLIELYMASWPFAPCRRDPCPKFRECQTVGRIPFSRVSSTAIRALILPSWRAPKFKRSQRGG